MSSQDLFAKLRHRGLMDETELTGLHRSTSLLSIDKPNTALLGLSDLMGGEDSHLFKTHDVKLADIPPQPLSTSEDDQEHETSGSSTSEDDHDDSGRNKTNGGGNATNSGGNTTIRGTKSLDRKISIPDISDINSSTNNSNNNNPMARSKTKKRRGEMVV